MTRRKESCCKFSQGCKNMLTVELYYPLPDENRFVYQILLEFLSLKLPER